LVGCDGGGCSERTTLLRRSFQTLGANRVVLALSIARMSDALGNSILFIAIPLFVAQIPSPLLPNVPQPLLVGILISLYGIFNSVLQPLTGALSDRMSTRMPFIVSGLLLMALGTFAFAFAVRYLDLIFIRAIQGVGVALTVPASLALLATSTRKATRGSAMGIYTTFRMVGFAVGPLVGGFLQVTYGFNAVFFTGTAFLLLAMVLVRVLVKEEPVDVSASRSQPLRLFNPEIFTSAMVSLGLAMFFMASAFSMMTTLENEFNARLHETALGFGIAFSALTFSRLIFQIPLGRLSDKIGRKPLLVTGLIAMAPATALLGFATSTVQLTGMRAFQGLASAAIAAPGFALAGDLSRIGGEGQQMSLMSMGFGFGIAIGPLLAGILAVHSFEMPFFVGGLACLVGAWIVRRFVPETVRREPVPSVAS
jgi:MFS family permease